MDRTQERLEKWCSGEGIEFEDKKAEDKYKKKTGRIADVVRLKIPDRVPVAPSFGMFSVLDNNLSCEDAFFDIEKGYHAGLKTLAEFDPDTFRLPIRQGRFWELIDCKQLALPGRDIPAIAGMQFVEKEYASTDEFYDSFLNDPTDFVLRMMLPRISGALEPLRHMPSLSGVFGYPLLMGMSMAMTHPELPGAFERLFDAAAELRKWSDISREKHNKIRAMGYPGDFGGSSAAPFDMIGDYIRGTKGIILDMFRCPEKLQAAMEKLTPILIDTGLRAKESGNPFVSIPLHKGADGFMSIEQYKTFYWPTLRKVMIGLIDEGLIPMPFFEGENTSRLEIIRDISKGKALYRFERVDLRKAKEILGGRIAFRGNVPAAILSKGTPEEVKSYVRNLIDVMGKNGGLIVDSGSVIDEARHENIKAMIEYSKEYGVY